MQRGQLLAEERKVNGGSSGPLTAGGVPLRWQDARAEVGAALPVCSDCAGGVGILAWGAKGSKDVKLPITGEWQP